MRTTTYTASLLAAALASAAIGGGIAACAPATVTKAPAAQPQASTAPAPVTTDANGATCPVTGLTADGYCPGSTPAPSDPASGPLGTSFTVTTQDNAGSPVSYEVAAVKVDQRSALAPYDQLGNPADHLTAVKFTITGKAGQSGDDANIDASAISSDTTQVQTRYNDTPDGGNFASGSFTVAPGQTVSGWVTFELPPGQTVASVQWAPGFDGSAATWTVAGS
jgi:hypothetical protein